MLNKLFQPIDIASLVFFRIVFGILAMAESMALFFYYHLHEHSFNVDGFQFKYYGFEWIQPFPEPLMSIFFSILVISAILIALGKWYRTATIVFATFFIYAFLIEKSHYLNHGYLLCWLGVVMIFLPANKSLSLDVRKNPQIRRSTTPAWTIALLCFLMSVVYFFGGIAKINPDWLNAMPLRFWLKAKSDIPIVGGIIEQEWVAWVMSYAGLLLDLFVVFFLLIKRTRLVAFILIVLFHLTNVIIFNIGIFPWLSIAITFLFFPSHIPRNWVAWLRKKWKFFRRKAEAWDNRMGATPANNKLIWQAGSAYRTPILSGLIFIAVFHCLYPLRHHLIKEPVVWTEEGHRYSWRMMLRSKQGRAEFTVTDAQTGETFVINPRDSLRRDQANDVTSHPDMILQYAHHLRDQYAERLDHSIEVRAKVRVRLNGNNYRDYIDSKVDLAKEEWSFFQHSDWILPFVVEEEQEYQRD